MSKLCTRATSTSLTLSPSKAQIEAAAPAACPVAVHIGIMRVELWAAWVVEIGLPATKRLSKPIGNRHSKGMS